MTVRDRLQKLMNSLPTESSAVTFTRADLEALLTGEGESTDQGRRSRDLTVEDVAEEMGRAPSTVRGWLGAGELRGYKLNGRDWRVPPAALEAYRETQLGESEPAGGESEDVNIAAWRGLG